MMTKLDGKLKNDLEQLVKENLLPNICALFDFDGNTYFNAVGQQPRSKPILKANQQHIFELFINMAL